MAETNIEGVVPVTAEVSPSLLGRGCLFEGKLRLDGTLRLEGTLRGEVTGDGTLVVGPEGQLLAEVDIGTLVVEGTVEGNIRARRSVEMRPSARVRGTVVTPSLFIDRGVTLEGSCQVLTPDPAPRNR